MILRRFSGLPVRRKLMLIVFLASGGALLLANAALEDFIANGSEVLVQFPEPW